MKLHKKYKLALVTGATSGIGKALSIALASEKISLILSGRDQSQLSQLASYLRPKTNVSFISADLLNPNDLEKLKNLIHEKTPDLVINSAGIGLYGDALTYKTSSQLKILDINAYALTEITLEAVRSLKSKNKNGTILNISSAASFFTFPSFSLYAASKAYVNSFSQSLDAELKDDKIRVFVACPGQVDTNFGKNAGRTTPKEQSKFAMNPQEAAKELIYQLKHDIPFHTFDWRTRYLIFVSKWLPNKLIQKILRKSVLARIDKRPFVRN